MPLYDIIPSSCHFCQIFYGRGKHNQKRAENTKLHNSQSIKTFHVTLNIVGEIQKNKSRSRQKNKPSREDPYYQLMTGTKQHNMEQRFFYSTSPGRKVTPISYPYLAFYLFGLQQLQTAANSPPQQPQSYPQPRHISHSDSFGNLLTMTFGKHKAISTQLNKHTMLTFSTRSGRSFLSVAVNRL